MRWKQMGDALVVDEWTPDTIAERNEKLAWMMRGRRPWGLIDGQLIPRGSSHQPIADALQELMQMKRGEWHSRMRGLALAGVATAAEGTFGALGAYPVPAELASVSDGTTEIGLLTAANGALYMPIPANGLLAPQAYRFVIAGRVTTTATAANLTWNVRLGNAITSPSLGASAAIAKTISITNAILLFKGDITIQSVGIAGTNAKAIGHFTAMLNSAAAGAYTSWLWGSTASASFDSTVAPNSSANGGQVFPSVLASAAAADPFIIGSVHFMDWN